MAKKAGKAPKLAGTRKRRVQFAYRAAEAKEVLVAGSFSGWQKTHRLKKDRTGTWKTSVLLEPGRYEYRFIVDGEWRNDPAARERVVNQFGGENDVVEVSSR